MKLFFQDERTIVTKYGFISPFVSTQYYSNYSYKNNKEFIEISEDLKKDTKLLKELISYRLLNDKKFIIEDSDFYIDMWNTDSYVADTLQEFLNAIRNVVQFGTYFNMVEKENGDIMVFGHEPPYSCFKDSFISISPMMFENTECTTLKSIFETINKKLPDYSVSKVYRRTNNSLTCTNLATVSSNFVISVYKPKSDYEKSLIFKYLKPKNSTAIINCIITGLLFEKDKKPFYCFFKKKTTSKVRDICAPNAEIKDVLKNLLQPLNKAYDMRKKGSNQFAYTIGRSIKDNANIHKNNKYVLKCDIRHFFDFCKWDLVLNYLRFIISNEILNDKEAMRILKAMIINKKTGGLYLGSPVSGVLANAILKPAAKYMKNVFEQKGMAFSMYADDIAVSSKYPINKKSVIGKIVYIFKFYKLPFKLHADKTHLVKNNGRKITGVRLNHKNELTVDRKRYRLLRSILHRLENNEEITMSKNVLIGNLSFFKYIDESGKCSNLLIKYKTVLSNYGININENAVPEYLDKSLEFEQETQII